MAPSRSEFVGRARELALLHDQLQDACVGRGSLAFYEGEPGIGKTRLVQELCKSALRKGALVLYGECEAAAKGIPYERLKRASRACMVDVDGSAPGEDSVAVTVELDRRLTELQDCLASPPRWPDLKPEEEAYRLREKLTGLVMSLAGPSLLVIVLEDLQWCDRETIKLLQNLGGEAGSSRFLFVGTYRETDLDEGHPLPRVRSELNRTGKPSHQQLGPLRAEETANLIRDLIGREPDAALAVRVHERCNGNPFFIEAIAKDLVEKHGAESLTGCSSLDLNDILPDSVRLAVRQRLEGLTAECRKVLELAAVLGRDVDIGLLHAALVDMEPETVLDLLDEAVSARVLVASGEDTRPVTYRFEHQLVREVVYASLLSGHKAKLHTLVVDALEGLPNLTSDHLGAICHHLARAGQGASQEQLVHYFGEAGEQAMNVYAYETAAEHFRKAAAHEPAPAHIVRQLARALAAAGDVKAACEQYDRVLELMAGNAEREQRAELRLEVAVFLCWVARYGEAIPYLEQALQECSDLQSPLMAKLMCQLAICVLWTGSPEDGRRLIDEAISLANNLGDPALKSHTALANAEWFGHTGDLERAAREYEAAGKLAIAAGEPRRAARAYHRVSTHHFQVGHLKDAISFSKRALGLAERCSDLLTLVKVRSIRAVIYWMRGDWKAARAERKEALKVARRVRQLPNEAFYLTSVDWGLRGWLGDASSIQEAISEIPDAVFPDPMFEPARWIFLTLGRVMQGRLEEARDILQREAGAIPPAPPPGGFEAAWLIAAIRLASCLCDVEDGPRALDWYDRLARYGNRLVPQTLPALELGRIASLNRRWADALRWLSKALEIAERESMRPFTAMARYELGLLHHRRHQEEDAPRAERYFQHARRLFEELEMRWHTEEADRRLEEVRQSPGGLTPSERKVLRLLADGKTYQEIADELVLSVRTVGTHLQHIYRKMGVSNRHEAAKWAVQHNLGPDAPKPPTT